MKCISNVSESVIQTWVSGRVPRKVVLLLGVHVNTWNGFIFAGMPATPTSARQAEQDLSCRPDAWEQALVVQSAFVPSRRHSLRCSMTHHLWTCRGPPLEFPVLYTPSRPRASCGRLSLSGFLPNHLSRAKASTCWSTTLNDK